MKISTAARQQGSNSLRRGLRVLSAFMERKPDWGVRELAAELQMHPTSVHRVLRALASEGFLEFDKSRRNYRFGAELYRMSAMVQQKSALVQISKPVMEALVHECGETVLLGLYHSQQMALSIVSQAESKNPLRYVVQFGDLLSLHAGAAPLAVLAFLSPDVIETVLAKPLVRFTDQTMTDPAQIRKALIQIRSIGYSFTRGEVTPGAIGIAAPVWDSQGVVACLNVTLPESRFKPGTEKIVGPKVQSAGLRLSTALGGKRNL